MPVTRGLHSLGRRLTISSPSAADMGLYECQAALPGSSVEPAQAQAFLSLIGNLGALPCLGLLGRASRLIAGPELEVGLSLGVCPLL